MPQPKQTRPVPIAPRRSPPAPETIDPRWLLKALAVALLAAILCGYATLCLLFYQGSWQLILHPSPTIARTPESSGLAFTTIHFDAAETGQPRLTAWWIPADPSSPRATFTLLYLHDGSGSLSDSLPTLTLLHQTGLNLFAIDFRGFGLSDASHHPSAESMQQDTAAALAYLTGTLHLAASTIVPCGTGLAAALAVNLALAHRELPAVILDNPVPDPAALALAAHPSDPVPMRLLFGDQFNLAKPLAALPTPKLLISGGPFASPASLSPEFESLLTRAPTPRMTVTLPAQASDPALLAALNRFLDQYLPPRQPPPRTSF